MHWAHAAQAYSRPVPPCPAKGHSEFYGSYTWFILTQVEQFPQLYYKATAQTIGPCMKCSQTKAQIVIYRAQNVVLHLDPTCCWHIILEPVVWACTSTLRMKVATSWLVPTPRAIFWPALLYSCGKMPKVCLQWTGREDCLPLQLREGERSHSGAQPGGRSHCWPVPGAAVLSSLPPQPVGRVPETGLCCLLNSLAWPNSLQTVLCSVLTLVDGMRGV